MIDRNNPIPLYFQIKNKIFEEIETGKLKPGEKLLPERELAFRYNVTRMTIRQSIRTLVDQGFLKSKGGSGTYVLDRHPHRPKKDKKAVNTKIIGVFVRDIQRGIMIDLIRGIEDKAIDAGYSTIICNTENRWEKANLYADQLIGNRVQGVIYTPIQELENGGKKEAGNETIIKKFIDNDIPIVLVDHACKSIETDLVVSDNFAGGYEMTKHLIESGHKRIAVIYDFLETSIEDRIDGYKKALSDHNIEYDESLVRNVKDYGFTDSFSKDVKDIISNLKTTAIFAMNDLLANDIYYHAKKNKLNIPNDISVVGYDDLPFANELKTPLTTIHQPIYQVAVESFKIIHERMQQPETHFKKIVLQNELIIRKSVKNIK